MSRQMIYVSSLEMNRIGPGGTNMHAEVGMVAQYYVSCLNVSFITDVTNLICFDF